MNKRLLKKLFIKGQIMGQYPTRWEIEYWYMFDKNDKTKREVITVMTIKYLIPVTIANNMQGLTLHKQYKDRILCSKVITMPELPFSAMSLHFPNAMEISKILESGGVQVVRNKKKG